MIVRIYPLFSTTHNVLMYILAKLRTGEVCPLSERRPVRRFRSKTTLPIAAAQKPMEPHDTALQAVLLPCCCGVGIVLCQMPALTYAKSYPLQMSRVITRLPWSSSPCDTCILRAIFPSQVALAVCVSPSGARKTWSLESRSVRGASYNNQRQPNNKGYILFV
ncbi:hypothetical protein PISMIDRAFT_350615 [Pisolithus microcarpus 441]|uniref:Uncharacterized protein n=1 Tax=Pisolithus microcarpus 441 TaxID=765257 RepID=A0A0C9YL49_9AGAM|nr:hypothetical protein BKA83DRAFT_350615 [Pisolithus microcarpus]KIK14529.1 hypothetical protein PISMIDRAFT_350615 [Pisolithus microcarpus 441]